MEEKILASIVATFTKELIKDSKELLGDIYETTQNEVKQFIGKDLKKYLDKQKEKYSYIKTLLRGNTPVYLYEIYYPLKLKYENRTINTDSIRSIFEVSQYVTIFGDAGSGKSTLVKHLFLNSIFEKFKIPILIELRYLNNIDTSFEEFIITVASLNKVAVNYNILQRLLDRGKFVFFLDGYDELVEDKKKTITREINDFVNKYDLNSYILTARPYSNIEHLPLFCNFRMKELSIDEGEIKGFIFKQLFAEKEIAIKIYKSIESGNKEYIQSFLKNPLLLSLYMLTYQSYAEIPDKKYIFYRRVINALFSEHDSKSKLGFVREKLSGLNQEEFETVLKSFSFISYFEGKFSFDKDYVNHKIKIIKNKHSEIKFDNTKFIRDLKSAIALWIDDDGELSFAHRSLQEYFTALLIKELTNSENERVYQKIITRFESRLGLTLREVENLLSLLSELDAYNYLKNFYLPLLQELNEALSNQDQETLNKSFLNFFTDGIGFHDEIHRSFYDDENIKTEIIKDVAIPLVKGTVNKTLYVHYPQTKKLFELLKIKYEKTDKDLASLNSIKSIEKDSEDDNRYKRLKKIIKFENGIPDEVYEILKSNELDKISNKYFLFIQSELKRTNGILKNKMDVDRDFVDFI